MTTFWTGFASGGYGYVGGDGVVKFDLKTLAKVKSVKVNGHINTGFAYNGYGYFGGNGDSIYQVDLTTMEVINKKRISGDCLYASSLGDGYGYFGGTTKSSIG